MNPMTQMNSMMNQEQKIDYLKEDAPIPGQKFACVSVVEPKNADVLKNRESFFATRFLKGFVEEYKQALEYSIKEGEDKLTDQIREKLDISYDNIKTLYYEFQQLSMEKLQQEWETANPDCDEPVIRGLKVRGVYPNEKIARVKAQEFHTQEEAVDVFIQPVGYWVPYCPLNMNDISPEFAEEKLNELVKSKIDESDKAKLAYEENKIKQIAIAQAETAAKKAANKAEVEAQAVQEEELELNDEDLLEMLESDDESDDETVEDVVEEVQAVSKPLPVIKQSKKKLTRKQLRQRKNRNRRNIRRRR